LNFPAQIFYKWVQMVPTVLYCTQNQWVCGLCPSSRIVDNYKIHNLRNWIWFQNVVFSSHLECRVLDKVHKSINCEDFQEFRTEICSKGCWYAYCVFVAGETMALHAGWCDPFRVMKTAVCSSGFWTSTWKDGCRILLLSQHSPQLCLITSVTWDSIQRDWNRSFNEVVYMCIGRLCWIDREQQYWPSVLRLIYSSVFIWMCYWMSLLVPVGYKCAWIQCPRGHEVSLSTSALRWQSYIFFAISPWLKVFLEFEIIRPQCVLC
jgi:hypothetical protein